MALAANAYFVGLTGQVRLRSGGAGGPLLDSVPVDNSMDLRVDLPGKADIPRYSYQEVLTHLADYAGNFRDKVVVIGYQKDDQLPGTSAEPRYGAEMHATAIFHTFKRQLYQTTSGSLSLPSDHSAGGDRSLPANSFH